MNEDEIVLYGQLMDDRINRCIITREEFEVKGRKTKLNFKKLREILNHRVFIDITEDLSFQEVPEKIEEEFYETLSKNNFRSGFYEQIHDDEESFIEYMLGGRG
jgi:hypothetical protein